MQELTVIGVEEGALLVASDDDARFRIEIDEALLSRLRQANSTDSNAPKISPREAQAHIRSGLSAEEVAQITGASVDYIRRFEGPVLAEREHMVTSALAVRVHPNADSEQTDEKPTFGGVLRDRLAKLGATGERWASWKEEERGWIIKLEFTSDSISHDARWAFEPRKLSLHPINTEAFTLSQQGELKEGMIPRLRAVGPDSEDSRFDSGAFAFDEPIDVLIDTAPQNEPLPYSRQTSTSPSSPAVTKAAIKRADEPKQSAGDTADLLEALRRRRGERETVPAKPSTSERSATPATPLQRVPRDMGNGAGSANETPAHGASSEGAESTKPASAPRSLWGAVARQQPAKAPQEAPAPAAATGPQRTAPRKGRASMPSWDEIVFGARPDDDPA